MHPVTYFPVATQRQFEINHRRIQGKPYARFFNGDLTVRDDALPAFVAPLETAHALPENEIDRLLDDGLMPGETGYCVLPNRGAYVASYVPFKGVPIDAMRWWWWWHSAESERYTLWHPYNHISVERSDRDSFTTPGLTDEQRYVGSIHRISEYIGPRLEQIDIRFTDPAELGLDAARMRARGMVHGCGWVSLQRPALKVCRMVHIARPTDDGFELRSRYWIGRDLSVRTPFGEIGIAPLMRYGPMGNPTTLATLAYEQLLHDQVEFTHLSTFLADLYAEFGSTPT